MIKNVLFFALFIFAIQLAAQTSETDSLKEARVPQVVVIAQKDRLLSGVPGAASYVKPLELRRIAPLTGNEVFRKLPGVHVVDEEGLGLRTNIGIRGLNPDRSSNILVLEDGVPVQLNPYGEPEMYYTPAIDRMAAIEVVKGSGQILFGPRTIGGVVNYITAGAPDEPETRVVLKGGSGGFFSSQLQYGTTHGSTGLIVNYLHKQADQIGVTGFRVNDLNAKINFTTGERSALGIKLQVYDEVSNSTYIGLTQNMFDSGNYYPVMAPDDELKVRRYALAATHKYFISNNLKLRTTAYGYTISRDWRRQGFTSDSAKPPQTGVVWGDAVIPNGAVFMLRESGLRNRAFAVGGVESKLTWDYRLGQQKHQLEAGGRILGEQAHETEYSGNSPAARSGKLIVDELRPGHAVSGFVQNKFNLSSRLAVTAGIRVEDYHFERRINLYKTASGVYRDTSIAAPSHVSALIPGIGFNYSLKNNATVFGGVHKGFAPPAIKNSVSNSGEVFPLDEQASWNYELGLRSAFARGFEAELTGFYLDFQKQVIPLSESSGGSGSGFANAGNTRHLGVEAAFRLDFGKIFHSAYSVYWEANATYSHATYNADRFVGAEKTNVKGNDLPYAPRWLSTQTLGFSAPWRLDVQVNGTYVSEQFTDELNTPSPAANGRSGLIPAYFVADISVRYEFLPWKTTLFASAKNLTDERYIASRRPTGIKVGLPRVLTGGVELRF
ncbi:MAG: TonB-dependent receptor plug domain-containing protein [Lewinellaceae bacterium]|nr:TonB-dependent receptor plug domain-containing protein [Lewinellaceae bacterium]